MKRFANLLLGILITLTTTAQTPQGFNYQAVIRNVEGEPLAEQNIRIRLTLQNQDGSNMFYTESHIKTTSPHGVISLAVGSGTILAGSLPGIPWESGDVFLKVELDPTGGTSYNLLGTSPLLAVPYALYALNGEPGADGVGITSITDNSDGTFTIHLSDGSTYTTSDFTGPIGPAGTGLNNRGTWVEGSTYEPNDYVFDRSENDPDINSMWIAQAEESFTSSTPPYLDQENWVEFQAPQGETGVGVLNTVDNSDGTFTINYSDGSSFTTANLTGPQGDAGVGIQGTEDNGDGTFTIHYTDGSSFTTSNLTGPAGADGMAIAGIEGQTLRHDGSDWVVSDNLFNANANVGVGTTSPSEKLEVAGNIKAQGRLIGQGVEVNQPLPEEEPIFVVRNSAGQIVFAVYEGGVRAYVDDTSKQTRGGFAIGGLSDQTKEETGIHYFSLTPDSVRFNIKNPTTKQTRGGFAIGGLSDQTKSIPQNLLYISPDSARIYIDTTSSAKQTRGGFAIGGLSDQTKGGSKDFLFVGQDSTRIYIDDNPTKQTRGGFAIGGLSDQTKAGQASFFNVYPDASGILESQPRILWYPLKNAFIAGQVKIDDPVDVGENSMSMGYETRASGGWSQALGYKSQALGNYSTAIGREAIAEFENSFAFGQFAQAKNSESYALGRGAIAEGFRSFAFGSAGVDSIGQTTGNSYAIGDYSFAIGQGSVAEGFGSVVLGLANNAVGDYSIALGYKTIASGYGSTALGRETIASNLYSTAMGKETLAQGTYSTSIGYKSNAQGVASVAMGIYTVASGQGSVALGSETTASGYYSLTSGQSSVASGGSSAAFGYSSTSSDSYSFSAGFFASASGLASIALGIYTEASNESSIAMGMSTTASGIHSTAMGVNSTASGSHSTAMGSSTASGLSSTAMGAGTKGIGEYSTAMGSLSESRGDYSLASGYHTIAEGDYSFATGNSSKANGEISTAMGSNAIAGGLHSVAMGTNINSTGDYSTAFGNTTTASGVNSTAMGENAEASGNYSTAIGSNIEAPSGYETVIGRHNLSSSPVSTTDWDPADKLFVIANGTGISNRSNAVTVLKNGNVGIGTISNPERKLEVNGSSTSDDNIIVYARSNYLGEIDINAFYGYSKPNDGFGTGGRFVGGKYGAYGSANASSVTSIYGVYGSATGSTGARYGGYFSAYNGWNNYAVYGIANTTAGSYAGYFNGNVQVTGTFTNPSDIKFKKMIVSIDNSLDKILKMKPREFEYNREEFPSINLPKGKQFGLIAQDLEILFPELVIEQNQTESNPEDNGKQWNELKYKSINYLGLIPILINGIQEQQKIIEELQEKNKELESLKAEIEAIKAFISK